MRCVREITALVVLVFVAASACGSDDDGADTTAAAVTTAAAAATTAAATTTTVATTVATTAAATTTAATATTVDPGLIEVDADAVRDTPMTATVPLGTNVTIVVRSATDQEFHLHGYDIEDSGTEVTFNFTADQAGEFELESHDTEAVLLILTVT
jgi:hypothetical protein